MDLGIPGGDNPPNRWGPPVLLGIDETGFWTPTSVTLKSRGNYRTFVQKGTPFKISIFQVLQFVAIWVPDGHEVAI